MRKTWGGGIHGKVVLGPVFRERGKGPKACSVVGTCANREAVSCKDGFL